MKRIILLCLVLGVSGYAAARWVDIPVKSSYGDYIMKCQELPDGFVRCYDHGDLNTMSIRYKVVKVREAR